MALTSQTGSRSRVFVYVCALWCLCVRVYVWVMCGCGLVRAGEFEGCRDGSALSTEQTEALATEYRYYVSQQLMAQRQYYEEKCSRVECQATRLLVELERRVQRLESDKSALSARLQVLETEVRCMGSGGDFVLPRTTPFRCIPHSVCPTVSLVCMCSCCDLGAWVNGSSAEEARAKVCGRSVKHGCVVLARWRLCGRTGPLFCAGVCRACTRVGTMHGHRATSDLTHS